jgi:hypothetical protein
LSLAVSGRATVKFYKPSAYKALLRCLLVNILGRQAFLNVPLPCPVGQREQHLEKLYLTTLLLNLGNGKTFRESLPVTARASIVFTLNTLCSNNGQSVQIKRMLIFVFTKLKYLLKCFPLRSIEP